VNNLALVDPVCAPEQSWVGWLRDHVDLHWLPGQWYPDIWLFSGLPDEPTSTVRVCAVRSCDARLSKSLMCMLCKTAFLDSKMSREEFIATHQVKRIRPKPMAILEDSPRCVVTNGGRRCPRSATGHSELCRSHHSAWQLYKKSGGDFQQWLSRVDHKIPDDRPADCLVQGCSRQVYPKTGKLCELHGYRYKYRRVDVPLEVWAKREPPKVADHQFTLAHLDETRRWEMLYALQKRCARGARINPQITRQVISFLQDEPNLATLTEAELHQLVERGKRTPNSRSYLYEFGRELRTAYDDFQGRAPTDRLIWDLVDVGISRDPSTVGGTRRRDGLDFSRISQDWLRDLAMNWTAEQTLTWRVKATHRSAVVVSDVLDQRDDHGVDVSALTHRDADTVAEAFRKLMNNNGTAPKMQSRRTMYTMFFRLIEYGRREGLLEEMPGSFGPHRNHVFGHDPVVEKASRAIPPIVMQQLDAGLDTIGRGHPYTGLDESLVHVMFRTAYVILRDTGRRPLEVVSLKKSCIEHDASGPVLVYDNHKNRRYGRRLPITQSTVDAIEEWQQIAPKVGVYLFPGVTAHSQHLLANRLAEVMREWVKAFPHIHVGEVDKTGTLVEFDRARIYPYAFRHSYAQRHADNGTPVDVLRDLMDHKSIATTTGYYSITSVRKREAIKTVGEYAMDRHGNPTPLTESTRYQMRSVAVPFGNCIEPTNVKAGGQACPIRFQCAGCGFYRPDPSYIPAIEEQLNALRADRETASAMDVASFVKDNLDAQIAEFTNVLSTMKHRLSELDPDERNRIHDAAATLRKARAGVPLPLTDITGAGKDNQP
jgi:integrase